MSEILNFKQHDTKSLYEACERFKLLKRKCPNHNTDVMEQMKIFSGGMKMQEEVQSRTKHMKRSKN
jgi:hypothetical protein